MVAAKDKSTCIETLSIKEKTEPSKHSAIKYVHDYKTVL